MIGDDVLVIVLAGGAGERLAPLTRDRAKPAVYFGGPYRIIDFVLSNCINSGLRHIFIATQYKSLSLNRHIRQGWTRRVGGARRVHRDPAAAEARRRALVPGHGRRGLPEPLLHRPRESALRRRPGRRSRLQDGLPEDAALPPGHGGEVTLAAIEVPIEDGRRFGIVAVDDTERVTGFLEKPAAPAGDARAAAPGAGVDGHLRLQQRRADQARSRKTPPSRDSHHDFGKDIIPALIGGGRTYAYPFYDENKKAAKYWRDIGTIDAYYEAHMDLCQVNPEFNMYDPEWPLRTYMPQAPPAKFVFAEDWRRGEAQDSLISQGCIVSGSQIHGSILCPNVRVHSFCTIEESILMPGVRVGRHARIRKAIIDRDVDIPRGALIGFNPEEDRRRHTVSEGGVVVVAPGEEPVRRRRSTKRHCRLEAEADRRG